MISILKWLQRNEFLVQIVIGFLCFYGVLLGLAVVCCPSAIEALVNTVASSLLLIAIFTFSFKVSNAATEAIKNAVTLAAIQESARPLHEIATDKMLDLSSDSVVVVKTPAKKEKKTTKKETTDVVESTPAEAPPPVEDVKPAADVVAQPTKKRTSRSKKSAQEA